MTAGPHTSSPDWGAFENHVRRRLVDPYQVPGLAVAVAREGHPVYAGGFGSRDREAALPAGPDTPFGFGSIVKSVTAVALLQLEEEGRLSTDDPVVKYLPEFRAGRGSRGRTAAERMTVHHFLTHTSGLPGPGDAIELRALARSLARDPVTREDPLFKSSPAARVLEEAEPIDSPEDLLAALAEADLEPFSPPGSVFSYSNEAYGLLGLIIQRVTGRRYSEYARERVFKPLGMRDTTVAFGEEGPRSDGAVLYVARAEEVVRAPVWLLSPSDVAAGGGGAQSTVRDLLRYLELFRRGGTVGGERILSPRSVERMYTPYARVDWGYYGYGLTIHPNYHGVSLVGHGGRTKGAQAQVFWIPERGLTAAGQANLMGVPVDAAALGGLNSLLGLPLKTRPWDFPDYHCPPERLDRYAGVYRHGDDTAILSLSEDGRLLARIGLTETPLRPVGVDAFTLPDGKGFEELVTFLNDSRGGVWALQYHYRTLRREGA